MKPIVRLQNVSKVFDPSLPPALQGIDLELKGQEIIGVVGPDGAGKTTFLRLLAALLLPSSGTIEVMGCDTGREGEKIHEVSAYMPQRFGLYEDLTVMQNLQLYADLKKLGSEERKERFESLLRFTGLAPFVGRLARALSGGMKQKLGLACALVKGPQILFLDEPSVGVDPISRRELWKMVTALLEEQVTILWSTTYLDEAEKCSRILLFNEGRLLYHGAPADLTRKMEGRVFRMADPSGQRRAHLAEVEKRDDVVDALIQGEDIRIVAKGKVFQGAEAIAPRLEDAFVDLLGGQKKGEAEFVQLAPDSPGGKEDLVSADNLVKRYGSFTAVDNISFQVKRGEIFGLLGPNGAGKSTTFKMLCGLLKPTEGTARVAGLDLQIAGSEARAKIGYMAQKFSLYGNITPAQNLQFFSGVYSAPADIDQLLHLFGLDGYKNVSADSLPLGHKQKLSLAAATLHWPEIYFLDEPTSGMDPVSRREFWSQMNGLVRKGKTILVSTHFMDEAENCDRIALIYKGKIIHLDTPDQLKEIAQSERHPHPTLEDAFIKLIEDYDAAHP
jgi:ABC-2 type transport system ATP-binding protein